MSRWQEFLAFLFGRKYVQIWEHGVSKVKYTRWRDYEGGKCLSARTWKGTVWLLPDGSIEGQGPYGGWKPLNFKVEK